ncbi:MAG: glycerol-3-phosphate dehydrogenase/oxidase [Hyphomicrobiales bacterium]
MNRDLMIKNLKSKSQEWDVIVIGGGATGIGTALEAVTRGYKTLLLEQEDFAKGTSSRSTKLVHGGVRYLAQGNISLVMEALRERGLLIQNAPHLVKNLEFVVPNYVWWRGPYYTIGLKIYDMMAGKLGFGSTIHISKKKVLKLMPNLKTEDLKGGIIYRDGQFDDSRLAINLVQTFTENGGIAINYCKVTGLLKNEAGSVEGVSAIDTESGEFFDIKSKAVVNATGVWADDILKMDDPKTKKTVMPSQGVHIVLDKCFMEGKIAMVIPKTSDGRVLFILPWHNKVIIGTTDTMVENASLEPRAFEQEIDFILETAGRYLTKSPQRSDVKSIYAGLRPLVAPSRDDEATKEISRGHKIMVGISGLVTIIGGKWTTYRKMGQDTIDKIAMVANLDSRDCITKTMSIHGYMEDVDFDDPLYFYGSDISHIKLMATEDDEFEKKLHKDLDYINAQVIWAVREEMARTVDDVLARRLRALFLDARAAIEAAPKVAEIMAKELNKDEVWIHQQVEKFKSIAKGYSLP